MNKILKSIRNVALAGVALFSLTLGAYAQSYAPTVFNQWYGYDTLKGTNSIPSLTTNSVPASVPQIELHVGTTNLPFNLEVTTWTTNATAATNSVYYNFKGSLDGVRWIPWFTLTGQYATNTVLPVVLTTNLDTTKYRYMKFDTIGVPGGTGTNMLATVTWGYWGPSFTK